jgi:hypothetical protein
VGTTAIGVGAGAYAIYEWTQSTNEAKKIKTLNGSKPLTNSDCGGSFNDDAFTSACSHRTKEIVGAVVAGVFGVAAAGSFYLAFIRDRDHTETQTANRGRKKRRELAITPIVTPDGGGATLRIDW